MIPLFKLIKKFIRTKCRKVYLIHNSFGGIIQKTLFLVI